MFTFYVQCGKISYAATIKCVTRNPGQGSNSVIGLSCTQLRPHGTPCLCTFNRWRTLTLLKDILKDICFSSHTLRLLRLSYLLLYLTFNLTISFLRTSAMLKHVIDIGWTSVSLSVTRCIQTAEYIVKLSSPHDSPFILVLCISRSLRNSDGVTPCGGAKYMGYKICAIFYQ